MLASKGEWHNTSQDLNFVLTLWHLVLSKHVCNGIHIFFQCIHSVILLILLILPLYRKTSEIIQNFGFTPKTHSVSCFILKQWVRTYKEQILINNLSFQVYLCINYELILCIYLLYNYKRCYFALLMCYYECDLFGVRARSSQAQLR